MIKQPNSRACFVCGRDNPGGLKMSFFETSPGEVMAELTIPEKFQGYPGVVHGGIIASILDETSGRSQMGPEPARFMYTAQLSIRYRKPVPVGKPIKVLGHALESKGRIAKAKAEIYGLDGMLLAEADTVLVDVPQETLNSVDPAALEWKVDFDTKAKGV